MHITYSPQRTDHTITYVFGSNTITITLDEQTDVFDFSALPDGEAVAITSVLDPCPLLSARRVDGELHVTLLRAVGPRPRNPQEFDAWKRLWTDDLEVVIGG